MSFSLTHAYSVSICVGSVSPDHCVYEAADGVSYDLGGLARVNKPMWGPVNDANSSVDYYINVCSKQHSNGTW